MRGLNRCEAPALFFAPGSIGRLFARYRTCGACGRVHRNPTRRPLLHNGRKARG